MPLPPESLPPYYMQGNAINNRVTHSDRPWLTLVTQADPNFVDAWYFRSIAHSSLGETNEANEDLKRGFALREKAGATARKRHTGIGGNQPGCRGNRGPPLLSKSPKPSKRCRPGGRFSGPQSGSWGNGILPAGRDQGDRHHRPGISRYRR